MQNLSFDIDIKHKKNADVYFTIAQRDIGYIIIIHHKYILLDREYESFTEINYKKYNDYFGIIFTITLLYLVRGGFPLSVTLRMKCVVSGFSTTGAFM